MTKKARRYNKGKLRYELQPNFAKKEISRAFSMGAAKYTTRDENGNIIDDGADNWRNGMPWRDVVASTIRHLEKYDKGEDFDYDWPQEILDEFGPSYHLANAAWGCMTLLEHYKINPKYDNRLHPYLNTPKVGLDIDQVLADFTEPWCDKWQIRRPTSWFFDRQIVEKFELMRKEGSLDDFYLNLPVLTKPEDIPFEPHCYITSRPVDTAITEEWLDRNGFPARPVYTVGLGQSKVDVIREAGCEIFVDDRFDNFQEINKAGICCYLFDQPHNQRYDVGYKRIKSLKQLFE